MLRNVIGVALALAIAGAPLVAGAAPQTPAPQAPAPVVPASYKLLVGDVVAISVLNHPEFSITSTRILVDKTVTYIYGPVVAEGKTVAELAAAISKVLLDRKQLKRPNVSVTLMASESRQVNVYGAVRAPGRLEYRENWKLLDALAGAGGLPTDRYEFYRIKLFRPDGSNQEVKVDKLYSGDPAENVPLRPGESIVVSELDVAQVSVRVTGEVRNPTTMIAPRDGSVVALMNAAGGPTPNAALSRATILRGDKTIAVDLRQYLKDGTLPADAQLKPGDTLVIPTNKEIFRVNGAVMRGGEMIYPDDRKLTVFEALSQAGLPSQGAELKKVTLTRKAADGQDVTTTMDVTRMLKGDLSADMPIQAGDNIYVPPTKNGHKLSPGEAFGLVNAASIFYNLLRNMR